MGTIAGHSPPAFDPAALKREFPGLADPGLGYLDSAATVQVPEAVPNALRRFEGEIRANVHEALMRRRRDRRLRPGARRWRSAALPLQGAQFGR